MPPSERQEFLGALASLREGVNRLTDAAEKLDDRQRGIKETLARHDTILESIRKDLVRLEEACAARDRDALKRHERQAERIEEVRADVRTLSNAQQPGAGLLSKLSPAAALVVLVVAMVLTAVVVVAVLNNIRGETTDVRDVPTFEGVLPGGG